MLRRETAVRLTTTGVGERCFARTIWQESWNDVEKS